MVQRVHKYANGGQVKSYADGGEVKKQQQPKKKKPKAKPELLGDGAAANAGRELKNRRKKQMEDLGI